MLPRPATRRWSSSTALTGARRPASAAASTVGRKRVLPKARGPAGQARRTAVLAVRRENGRCRRSARRQSAAPGRHPVQRRPACTDLRCVVRRAPPSAARHAQMDDEPGRRIAALGPGPKRQQQILAPPPRLRKCGPPSSARQLARARRFAAPGAEHPHAGHGRPGSTAASWRRTVSTSGSSGMNGHTLRFQPVGPLLDVHHQRHRQLHHVGHAVPDEGRGPRNFLPGQLQHQLVMDLQQQPRLKPFRFSRRWPPPWPA